MIEEVLLDVECSYLPEDRLYIKSVAEEDARYNRVSGIYVETVDSGSEDPTQIKLSKETAYELAEAMVKVLEWYDEN